jgi:hypothetical protein
MRAGMGLLSFAFAFAAAAFTFLSHIVSSFLKSVPNMITIRVKERLTNLQEEK